jgi:hypothetical protein
VDRRRAGSRRRHQGRQWRQKVRWSRPGSEKSSGAQGLQAQVRNDPPNHRLLQDRRNDLQLATAVRAVLHVDREQTLEQLGRF